MALAPFEESYGAAAPGHTDKSKLLNMATHKAHNDVFRQAGAKIVGKIECDSQARQV